MADELTAKEVERLGRMALAVYYELDAVSDDLWEMAPDKSESFTHVAAAVAREVRREREEEVKRLRRAVKEIHIILHGIPDEHLAMCVIEGIVLMALEWVKIEEADATKPPPGG